MEAESGNSGKARELLEKGSQMDPWHVPIWQAWGVLEFRCGDIEKARALFQEVGLAACIHMSSPQNKLLGLLLLL